MNLKCALLGHSPLEIKDSVSPGNYVNTISTRVICSRCSEVLQFPTYSILLTNKGQHVVEELREVVSGTKMGEP